MTPQDTIPSSKSVADTGDMANQVTTTQVASMSAFAALTTSPPAIYLLSWDGTMATAGAAGMFLPCAPATADHATVVVTAGGQTYRRVFSGGVDPAWYGAIGDGVSHPASASFATLNALQAIFPGAYSLAQEIDFLALQAAFSSGLGVLSPKRHYMMVNAVTASDDQPLRWISGLAKGDLGLSNLDFTAMKSVPSDMELCDDPNLTHGFDNVPGSTQWSWSMGSYPKALVTDPTFGPDGCTYIDPSSANIFQGALSAGVLTVTGFQNRPPIAVGDTIYTSDWSWQIPSFKVVSFGSGTGGDGTYNVDNTTGTLSAQTMSTATGHYTQFGKRMTLPAGTYKVSVTAIISEGASYANGNTQPAAIGIGFNSNGPGNGDNPMGNSLYVHPVNYFAEPITETYEFTFGLEASATAFFTLQVSGYCNVNFTKASITHIPNNCLVLATRDGSPEHYPQPVPVANAMITGPGNDPALIGVLFNSYFNTDGTICNFEQVATSGCGIGWDFRNGAYLGEYWDCSPSGSEYAIRFLPGSVNAGENFRFYGGGLANGNCLLYNPGGAEFSFYSTTFDYSVQIVGQNAGRVEFFGVHCETWGPSTQTPLFEMIGSGALIWHGGMILLAGDHTTYACPPVALTTTGAQFTMFGTQPYNLTCADGRAMSGPGSFKSFALDNTGNMNMGSIKNFANDALGLAGDFAVQASSSVCTDFLGIGGGLYPDAGSTQVDRWNSDDFTMEWSTDFVCDGLARSIKCTKKKAGVNHRLIFAVPIDAYQSGNINIRCLFPYDASGNAATTDNEPDADAMIVSPGAIAANDGSQIYAVYVRAFKVATIGYDNWGRPFFGPGESFCGEADYHVDPRGSNVWKNSGAAASYLGNPSAAAITDRVSGVSSPKSATHMILMLDTQNYCAGTFYIGGISADVF